MIRSYWLHHTYDGQPPDCVGTSEEITAFRAAHADEVARLRRAFLKLERKCVARLKTWQGRRDDPWTSWHGIEGDD